MIRLKENKFNRILLLCGLTGGNMVEYQKQAPSVCSDFCLYKIHMTLLVKLYICVSLRMQATRADLVAMTNVMRRVVLANSVN